MKVACVGDNCIDYYDQTGEAFPGGNPVNVSVYLSRLGMKSAYIGAVGDDRYGSLLSEAVAAHGVDVSHIQVKPGATALSHVELVNGDRVFGDYEEGVMKDFRLSDEDLSFVCAHDLMVTGLWGRTESYLAEIKRHGVIVAFDSADRPYDDAGKIAMQCADLFFFSNDTASDDELRLILRDIAAHGARTVIATRGERGSMAYSGGVFYKCGIVDCKVVDTMGAGDSFIAGFIYSRLHGNSIQFCMQKGAETAAETIAYKGAW